MIVEKARIKTSFNEEIVVPAEMGNKIQEAMYADVKFVKISETPIRIIKVNSILSLEYFKANEIEPRDTVFKLKEVTRANENSEGYKRYLEAKANFVNKTIESKKRV